MPQTPVDVFTGPSIVNSPARARHARRPGPLHPFEGGDAFAALYTQSTTATALAAGDFRHSAAGKRREEATALEGSAYTALSVSGTLSAVSHLCSAGGEGGDQEGRRKDRESCHR